MDTLLYQLSIICFLVLVNGLFAMAEIAVVSSRKGRLKSLSQAGDVRAQTALGLAEAPSRFLSTVQVGITLVGVLAGALGGYKVAEPIANSLRSVTFLARYADAIGFVVVVTAIAYLSLVVGELVPKRVALSAPEQVARLLAGPMKGLARLAQPVVWLLDASSGLVVRLLGVREKPDQLVTEDEIKILLREGLEQGVFYQAESEMIESVLTLDRLPVRDIMTPVPKILWLNQDDPHEVIWHKIVVSQHSSFPVYRGSRDNVVGIVSVKSLYANLAAGVTIKLADLVVPALIVPETQRVIQLLETFRQSGRHIALVANEFGGIVGLVTLTDAMEAIAGDFESVEERLKPAAKKREDGSWLVDAMIDVSELEEVLPGVSFDPPEERDYHTLAGFVVKQLGRLPHEGEAIQEQGYRFEIIDMDRHRVDKVLVIRLPDAEAPQNT